MRILGCIFVLVVACSVIDIYKRVLKNFLGIVLMDCVSCVKFLRIIFGCGFLVFGCFRQVFSLLGLFLLFGLGLKFWDFGWQYWGFSQCLCVLGGVWSELRNGVGSKIVIDRISNSKKLSCKCGWIVNEELDGNKECGDDCDDEHGTYDENEESDVVELRKLVKMERYRANAAYLELEKERLAAATAAEETMAMILRLQNEKSLIEMEANQYRNLVEKKQLHDQEVIKSLRWIAMKHESDRSVLEDQVRLLKQKLNLDLNDDEGEYSEGDQSEGVDEFLSFPNANFEDVVADGLISSLDKGLVTSFNQSYVAEYPFEIASSRAASSYYE